MKKKLFFIIFFLFLFNIAYVNSYNSTDINITQETGFAHLNLSNENIVLYMPFDSNVSDTTVYDYSKNNNDGTIHGAIYTEAGKLGGAMEFDGGNDYIKLSNNIFLNNSFSVGVWVNLADSMAGFNRIIGHWGDFELAIAGSDVLYYYLEYSNNTLTGWRSTGVSLPINSWNYITLVSDDNGFEIYKNSILIYNESTGVGLMIDNHDLHFGSENAGGSNFKGSIDQVLIYNKTLNAIEVNETYENQSEIFVDNGTMLFQNISIGANNTVNITLNDCQEYMNTKLSAKINKGSFEDFTNCKINDYKVTGNTTSLNLTILFKSNQYNFYSPLIMGNITLDEFYSVPECKLNTTLQSLTPNIYNKNETLSMHYTGTENATISVSWYVNNALQLLQNNTAENDTIIEFILSNEYFNEDDRVKAIVQLNNSCGNTSSFTLEEEIGGESEMIILLGILLLLAFLFLGVGIWTEEIVFSVVSAIIFVIDGLIMITTEFSEIDSKFTVGIGVILILVGAFIALISFKGGD